MILKIAVLSGDGIGPEVTKQSIKVLKSLGKKFNHKIKLESGLVGAVAEAGTNLLPSINIEIWVVLSCLITWLILIRGSYSILENILLGMVLVFSLITLIIAFSMQSTSYELNTAQVFSGLNFSLPFEYLPLALAVFGFTGISYGEIMAYTYWCLEMGYAQGDAEDIQ